MKKLLIALAILGASVMPVRADQYGDDTGEVKGEQVDEHPAREVDAGIADMQMWQVIALTGGVAVAATALYKLSYGLYIFDK